MRPIKPEDDEFMQRKANKYKCSFNTEPILLKAAYLLVYILYFACARLGF
jgi:hypothetical protein